MKKFLLSAILLSFLVSLVSFVGLADAGSIECYVGARKIASVRAENFENAIWISVPEMAKTLEMKMEISGEEITLSRDSLRIRLIEGSIAAWVGNSLVALYESTRTLNGITWIEERSANALFRGIFGNNQQVSFKNASGVDTPKVVNEKTKPPEQVLYNAPKVKQEIKKTEPTAAPAPQVAAVADIKEIRWSSSNGKVRAVLVCDGEKDPVLKKDKENTRLVISSANFGNVDKNSKFPERVQTKEENGSLVFSGKWNKIDVIALKNPKRIVLDFFYDEKQPALKQTQTPSVIINAPKVEGSGIVVIDAGHGGQDPGAVANDVREKDINLAIALKIESVLKSRGVKTEMTRRTDVYLPLTARTEIANRLNAEIFVSVHANALPKGKNAAGFEIYIMALPTDRDALELAKFENRELVDGKINVAVSDKNTQLLVQTLSQEEKKKVSIILGDMKQNDKIAKSTKLTENLFSFGNKLGLPMRRVAQAPFFVLRGTDNVTSVLLETGFVTDKREVQLLVHPGYQQRVADAMAEGIIAYLKEGGK